MKNPNEMKNLKIFDPDPEKNFTKAKVARQEHTDLNRVKTPNEMKNLKIFDPDPEKNFTKA